MSLRVRREWHDELVAHYKYEGQKRSFEERQCPTGECVASRTDLQLSAQLLRLPSFELLSTPLSRGRKSRTSWLNLTKGHRSTSRPTHA